MRASYARSLLRPCLSSHCVWFIRQFLCVSKWHFLVFTFNLNLYLEINSNKINIFSVSLCVCVCLRINFKQNVCPLRFDFLIAERKTQVFPILSVISAERVHKSSTRPPRRNKTASRRYLAVFRIHYRSKIRFVLRMQMRARFSALRLCE